MASEDNKEIPLEFAIIEMNDCTHPVVTPWVSVHDFNVMKGLYFIADRLLTGEFEFLSTEPLPRASIQNRELMV